MYKSEKCMSHGLPKEWKCVVHALQNSKQNLYTPSANPTKPSPNHCFKPLTKPLQTIFKPLCPLRGLHSLHLNKSKRGEYNRGLALQAYLLYTINGSACRSLPIKHIIKGFPRNITKHTKRNMLRHSTNPCGKPSFFPLPLEGAGGWTQSKAFAPAKGYLFPSLAHLYPSHSPKPEQTSAGAK